MQQAITALNELGIRVIGLTSSAVAEEDAEPPVVEEVAGSSDRPALITHGAIIRGYAVRVLGLEFGRRHHLVLPRNTSVTRVRLGTAAPALSSYGVIGY